MSSSAYWLLLLVGYGFSVLVESTILWFGLSARHSWGRRLFAGIWLTSCTYPVVALVLPFFISPRDSRTSYLLVAETFAPLAECLLFWVAFGRSVHGVPKALLRDFGAIIAANLASFAVGELWYRWSWS